MLKYILVSKRRTYLKSIFSIKKTPIIKVFCAKAPSIDGYSSEIVLYFKKTELEN